MHAATLAPLPQIQEDPRAAVGRTAVPIGLFDQDQQASIFDGPIGKWLLQPGVVAASMDPQNPAEHHHPMSMPVGVNEGVLYSGSFAKYAAAFFKMSRSSSARRRAARSL